MKTLSKQDPCACAFNLVHGKILPATGLTFGNVAVTLPVKLPRVLARGTDYCIVEKAGKLQAVTKFDAGALGGFHVGLDGTVVLGSLWDRSFRPACSDPRGMVLILGLFWVDIYLLGTDSAAHGTSRPGVTIADGSSPATKNFGAKTSGLNWFEACEVLAIHGKQLLSVAEFAFAANGVTQDKTCGRDPVKTGYVKGLRSLWGLEQATGCMWTWSRDKTASGYPRLMGGYWSSSRAGARRFNDYYANISDSGVGARGRCDHLILA